MIKLEKIAHRFKGLFKPRPLSLSSKQHEQIDLYSTVIETDFEHVKYKDKLDSHVPLTLGRQGWNEMPLEQARCQQVRQRLEEGLRMGRENCLHCEIILPMGLLTKLAQDILRMSENEPCGIKGCILYINLESKETVKLATVHMDPSNLGTFELYLTLKEDVRSQVLVEKMVVYLRGLFQGEHWERVPKVLCPGYQLEKKKLYRPDQDFWNSK